MVSPRGTSRTSIAAVASVIGGESATPRWALSSRSRGGLRRAGMLPRRHVPHPFEEAVDDGGPEEAGGIAACRRAQPRRELGTFHQAAESAGQLGALGGLDHDRVPVGPGVLLTGGADHGDSAGGPGLET